MLMDIERRGADTVVHLKGNFDESGCRSLLARISNDIVDEPGCVVLVMEEVDSISSWGLAAIFRLHMNFHALGKRLKIVRPSPIVSKLFEIAGLVGELDVFPSEDEALKKDDE